MQTCSATRLEYDLYEEHITKVSEPREFKILVVDDNRDFANILCCYFNYLGFTAKAAYEPAVAIDKIARMTPDLVFCDIGLPGKGGYMLADKIRADHTLDATLLVALTYFHQERIKYYALEHGFDAYISRPIRAAHLKVIYEQAALRQLQFGRGLELVNAG